MILRILAISMAALLSACATTQGDAEARAETEKVALVVQSLQSSMAALQQQRDRVAEASARQRNYQQQLARQQESAVAENQFTWKVAGDTERLRVLDTLRNESALFVLRMDQEARAAQQAEQDAAKARSAVSYEAARLNETSVKLASLAEEKSRRDNLKFLARYAAQVRKDIKALNEKAAQENADYAETEQGGKQ